MDFKIGSKAVYPRQGVTEVLGIETKEIMGSKQDFYVLRVLDTKQNIYIPVAKVTQVGLREVMDRKSVQQVYDILQGHASRGGHGNWNRRYRAYNDKLNTGSAVEIAEVLRDLNRLKSDKNLSFGERKMLDTARRLLVQELSVAEKASEADVEGRIEACFGI